MRREKWRGPAVLMILALGIMAGSWQRTASAEVVHVGISTVGLYEVPTEIAKRKGFYKDEGLEVRKVAVKTGIQVSALLAGELDYSTVGGVSLRAIVKGIPLKLVMGWFDRPLHLLVGRPGIKTVKDLKGKRVAVSSFGSTPHVMLREALAKNGMDPDHDVTILAIGGSSARFAALRAQSVDAAPLDVAYIEKTDKLGFTNILYFGDVVDLPLGGFAVSEEKIKTNPDQIRRVVRATLKGVRFMKSHKDETIAIMKSYLKLSDEYADRIYDFALRSLNVDGTIAKKSLANEIRLARRRLHVKEEIPEDKVVDWRFIREALSKR